MQLRWDDFELYIKMIKWVITCDLSHLITKSRDISTACAFINNESDLMFPMLKVAAKPHQSRFAFDFQLELDLPIPYS